MQLQAQLKPVHLKPLSEQVMVITGATSGIGLVTARKAARKGARLVLAARNGDALRTLRTEIEDKGGEAEVVAADVGRQEDVNRIRDAALSRFGGFDTWVNNAGISIYGRLEKIPMEDQKRLFDTNFWGVVYGSLAACEHLREHGGKLINLGSALSERAIPEQGIYSASKAAVMGYTDALRMELEMEGAPISVTLIKPGAIDTPYKQHAGNYLGVEGKNPPPVYAPDTVANAIVYAAAHHTRDVVVGFGGKLTTTLGNIAPRVTDVVMSRVMPTLQRSDEELQRDPRGALYEPGEALQERGGYHWTREQSLYSAAVRHSGITVAAAAGTAALIYGVSRARRRAS